MRSKWIISLVLVLTLIIGLVPIGQPVYAVGTGEFLVSDYGTGLDAYYRWYRGYIFQVTEETKVTALVGGGNGGIFGGGIYTIENVNGVIKPKELLGSVAFTGTTPDQVAAFIGKDYVTLFPGTDYLIVSGRQSPGGDGEPLGYVIENINVSDLESNSTRIKEGTWFPRDNNKAVQFKYYDVAPSGLIGKIHSLTDNLPRLGFQYETNFDKPAIATLEPEVTSSGVTLRGQLENTGGTETTVFFEWGTEHDLSTSGCFVPADAQTVTESVYTHEITDIADGEYCYRVVAINEAGRVEGIIKDFEIVSDAAYTVEHYQQDVTGDGYTLAEKEEKTGTVDTSVTAVAKTYIGFSENTSYGDRIVNGNILPDGSLVLKLYYDRDIFTVTFKDYNGNDLKKESVRYGGAATPPVAPTMEGYISTGWDKAFDNITSDMEIRAQYKVLQYTVNFESNGGSTVDPIAGDYGTTINKPTAPTKEGYIFEGWYKDSELINQWDFENDKVPAKNITLFAKYHCISSDTRKPAKREQSKSREDINVIVDDQKNNKDVNISDERETLTIQIDSNEPKQIRTQLTGNIVKRMEQEKQILIIKTGDVKYSIPAKEITIDAVAKTLGVKSDSLEDIVVDIMITKVDEQKKAEIIKNAATGGYEILVHPEQFKIFAKTESKTGETKEITVSNFTTYVSRILEIPANIDPEKVTTGIIYNGDGVFSHIPTSVFQDDGKWYAKLNSLTNSIYSVVWNPVYVETVESHWSKEAVNDMASRLVIKAPESFHPDKEIARGEFAEIITKAIGIYRTQTVQENQFSDVTVTNELGDAITIAVDYGIMTGYTDGTFRPDAQITREEAMVMYARAMDIVRLEEIDNDRIETYRDKGQISVWTYDAVKKVINSGVFNGTTENTIAPKRTLTCAEAATAIRNLLIKSKLIND